MNIKNVVILPTVHAMVNSVGMFCDDNTLCVLRRKDQGNKFFDTDDGSPIHGIIIPHFIYIISDDKIEKGDNVYNSLEEKIRIQISRYIHSADKKIIATNDPSLYLINETLKPLENNFSEKFVATYNRIKKVKRLLYA